MSLKDNKRIKNNNLEFKQWLLNVGDGFFKTEFERYNEVINIPNEILEILLNQIIKNFSKVLF